MLEMFAEGVAVNEDIHQIHKVGFQWFPDLSLAPMPSFLTRPK